MKIILTVCSLLSALRIVCVSCCRVFVDGALASFPLVHGFRSLLVENTAFGSCVYYDVQTVCKQLSVEKWTESRAMFPLRHSFSPHSPTREVIPSTRLQSLFFFCLDIAVFAKYVWSLKPLRGISGCFDSNYHKNKCLNLVWGFKLLQKHVLCTRRAAQWSRQSRK